MAKKQTFESKLSKGAPAKVVKMVFSYKSSATGTWKFGEQYVKVPHDTDEQKYLDEQLTANKARLEA